MSGREPQQERSRVTRLRLLDATIDSLAEVGWAGTTVVAVAARAGVSRGAAQHHFATRDELVTAAVNKVRIEITEAMRKRETDLPDTQDRTLAVLELLGDLWTSTFGRAATHLWVAASTDPSLRALVLPLEQEVNRDLYKVTVELLGSDTDDPQVRRAVGLSLQLIRGMGLGALLRHDPHRRRAELAQWAAMLAAVPGAIGGLAPGVATAKAGTRRR